VIYKAYKSGTAEPAAQDIIYGVLLVIHRKIAT